MKLNILLAGSAALLLVGCLVYAESNKRLDATYENINKIYASPVVQSKASEDREDGIFPVLSLSSNIAPINTLIPFTAKILTKERGVCEVHGLAEGSISDDRIIYSVDSVQCGSFHKKIYASIGFLSHPYRDGNRYFLSATGMKIDIPLTLPNGERCGSYKKLIETEKLFFACFDKQCREILSL